MEVNLPNKLHPGEIVKSLVLVTLQVEFHPSRENRIIVTSCLKELLSKFKVTCLCN